MKNSVLINPEVLPEFLNAGFFEVKTPWVHFSRTLDVDALIFVTSGNFMICEDEIEYNVPKNNMFFLKNGKRHYGKTEIKAGSTWYWVCFSEQNKGENLYPLPKQLQIQDVNSLVNSLKELISLEKSSSQFHDVLANNVLHKMFLEILIPSNLASLNAYSGKKILANDIMKYLEKNVAEKFSAQKIVEQFNMNYSYLCRVFKEETNSTINEFYTELRIRKSVEMLKENKLTISEISEALSFPNPYYFSKVFKKTMGYSPKNYIKQLYF